MVDERGYELAEALKAQAALRRTAGMGEERFSIEALVGMISDEIETLRGQGRTDEEIARVIAGSSAVRVSAEEIGRYYASAEERGRP